MKTVSQATPVTNRRHMQLRCPLLALLDQAKHTPGSVLKVLAASTASISMSLLSDDITAGATATVDNSAVAAVVGMGTGMLLDHANDVAVTAAATAAGGTIATTTATGASAKPRSDHAPGRAVGATVPGAHSQVASLAVAVVSVVRAATNAVVKHLAGVHVRSEARDRALFALCRLVDALVDVTSGLGNDGVDATVRDELTAALAALATAGGNSDPYADHLLMYAKQAVLHVRQDAGSKMRELLATTTRFIAGGLHLASAAAAKDIGGVIAALGELKSAASELSANQPEEWYGSVVSICARVCEKEGKEGKKETQSVGVLVCMNERLVALVSLMAMSGTTSSDCWQTYRPLA